MNALQKIVQAAKKLQKAHPKMEWKSAVKQASAAYRKGKKVGQTHKDTRSHNVNIRVVSGVKKKAAKKARTGSVLLLEKNDKPGKKPTRVYRVNRTKAGTFKKFARLRGTGMPEYKDPDLARDILLTADSDSSLYFQRRQPIEKNLYRKFVKGTFDLEKSAKLWRYYIDAADKLYNREFVDRKAKGFLLSVNDRKLLAMEKAQEFYGDLKQGNTY